MKDKVVITFSQEELRTLNKIVQDADGKRAIEYFYSFYSPLFHLR